MNTLTQKLSGALTAIIILAMPISAFAGRNRFIRKLDEDNPQLGYTLLCIAATFFLYSAATNWGWAFSSFVSRLAEEVIGRSGMRVIFALTAIYCGQIGINGLIYPPENDAQKYAQRCGDTGTYSFVDSDGECACVSGFAWLEDANPISFQCIPTAEG